MTTEDLLRALRDKREDATARIDMDTLPVPPLYPVATEAELVNAERRMGLSLPQLLRRVYAEVGNGGYGPGAGLLGVTGGYPDADGRWLPERYEFLRTEGWPPALLPLWDWGCASWSCVDAATPEGTIVTMDEFGQTKTRFTLASWLEQWVLGTYLHSELYEIGTATIINPFTRQAMPVKRRARPKGTPQ
ncbi:SMI1/KNR4 family protein [Archangium lansingense]|uniref:SMI1/KNR4 family protein n=1 Tax=Archangium lansingense TaxID=2995310 RepID=UPI003B7FCBA0